MGCAEAVGGKQSHDDDPELINTAPASSAAHLEQGSLGVLGSRTRVSQGSPFPAPLLICASLLLISKRQEVEGWVT